MTQMKNVKLTKTFEGKTPSKAHFKKLPNINYLQVLKSTVYIFIHKEKQILKSEKFETQALNGLLIRYNRHTIYEIFIQSQNNVIQVKDLQVFKNTGKKAIKFLPNFQEKPIFKKFLANN